MVFVKPLKHAVMRGLLDIDLKEKEVESEKPKQSKKNLN